ncbi:MAG: Phospho-N-acetylmuramoyl-pentapeptide-transferase [Chlamydiia bacterium]|nr:Phospho-N-acetylmuramoyl-pentapeptide-transferase [Chlamydiia bacterium]
MFLVFLKWMQGFDISVPHLFFYTSFKMLMSALSSFVLTLVVGKAFIAKLVSLKIGHKVRVTDVAVLAGSYNKESQIPSMGGLLFIFTIITSNLLWMDIQSPFTFLFTFTLVSMGLIGFIDDYLKIRNKGGLSARVKFLMQIACVFFITLYLHNESFSQAIHSVMNFHSIELKNTEVTGSLQSFMSHIYIPFMKHPFIIGSSMFTFLFSMFVLIGGMNAVNLTDGLDGLATGCMLMVAFVFAIIAFISNHVFVADYLNILYIEGAGDIAIFLSSLIGGLLGFLWFNSYPAQVFMGDTGSLALGAIIGLTSIVLRREFLLALVGGIFVIETLSVILQIFWVRFFKRRLFSCTPIHHHFEIKGWHESKIVIRFWMIGLVLSFLGLISLKVQ